MSRRIIGNTVGTPISPAAIERKIKPVKTINGIEADQNGNVDISEEVAALCEHSTIVTTDKGESILLTDSAKAKLHGLKLYGKSTQDGTPTPENPVEIVSAGQDGEIGVKACGKNIVPVLADKTDERYGGLSRKYMADGGYKFTGTSKVAHWSSELAIIMTVPADGVYSLTIDADILTTKYFSYSHIRDGSTIKSGVPKTKHIYTAEMQRGDELSVTLGADAGEVVNTTLYVQLELGSTATAFEKPKGITSAIIPTPNGLPGIKVASGGNYTDSTGQQWVCDEIDFERGVYIQRCIFGDSSKLIFNAEYENNNRYDGKIFSDPVLGELEMPRGVGLCNFVAKGSWSTKDEVHYFYSHYGVNVWLPKTLDLETIKANIVFMGILQTPIERPLTEDDLSQFGTLHTNYPTTTILNDEGAGMEVSYVADTKNYIDKKFNELAAAIVANA